MIRRATHDDLSDVVRIYKEAHDAEEKGIQVTCRSLK